MAVLVQLLHSCVARRSALVRGPQTSKSEIEQYEKEIAKIQMLIQAVEDGGNGAVSGFESTVTRIVARKAKFLSEEDSWMKKWHQPETQ